MYPLCHYYIGMVRLSVRLPESLHLRLHLMSKQMKKSLSGLTQELLDQGLAKIEKARLPHMYSELSKLKGACKKGITDTSATIDEVLYGENGAWKGQRK